jgi:hypothetical protein
MLLGLNGFSSKPHNGGPQRCPDLDTKLARSGVRTQPGTANRDEPGPDPQSNGVSSSSAAEHACCDGRSVFAAGRL